VRSAAWPAVYRSADGAPGSIGVSRGYNRSVKVPRKILIPVALVWAFLVLYPNPAVLVRSASNMLHPQIDPAAAAGLAASLPNDPKSIERAVLTKIVPYAYDWQVNGVPWYFPTTAEAVASGRGDCESRALVLASILAAKHIPYQLRMSFDHIWVDYPGKVANSLENNNVTFAVRRGGHYVLHWPKDFHPYQELKDQLAIYWTPMPAVRKALFAGGTLLILSVNLLAGWRRRVVGGDLPAPAD
jgi:hypothetical protein